ncbi:hypothetical protein OSCT_2006 [Oscillochloris trichoides DG-6]|uniref:Uncharacterized protein n=1 Tax=Oscillochloris trichoides DG-6 TaxID=765420 RepID=E1IFA5_9CHLR|nr:hypothetical protein [Oscillochloris trichoides]EFO80145.1 hypothetical protein OSCT_2006 [Oscillochloris trichoides DG-6]
MAVIMATFTDQRDANRAAAALRENGFTGAKVGTSAGDAGDLVGLGATEYSFRNMIIIGSALAGAVALGAFGFLLGMFSMDTPDVRGMGNIYSIGPALSSLVMFTAGLAVFGGISGFLGGLLASMGAVKWLRNSLANNEAPKRPMVTIPVSSSREEDIAHEVLRIVGPPFEVVVR